ncbi:MAG: hypothetical protein IJ228_11785 [Succinivibrio sp.]|nr:hypothetical protein [Succinivibrio sp.]
MSSRIPGRKRLLFLITLSFANVLSDLLVLALAFGLGNLCFALWVRHSYLSYALALCATLVLAFVGCLILVYLSARALLRSYERHKQDSHQDDGYAQVTLKAVSYDQSALDYSSLCMALCAAFVMVCIDKAMFGGIAPDVQNLVVEQSAANRLISMIHANVYFVYTLTVLGYFLLLSLCDVLLGRLRFNLLFWLCGYRCHRVNLTLENALDEQGLELQNIFLFSGREPLSRQLVVVKLSDYLYATLSLTASRSPSADQA